MLVADTAFGPFYLAYSVAEDSRRELYFTFGRSF